MDRLEDIILIMHRNPHFVFTFDHSNVDGGKGPNTKGKPANKLIADAFALVEQGKHEEGRAMFARFLEDHPGHAKVPEARFWMGYSFYLDGAPIPPPTLRLRPEDYGRVFWDTVRGDIAGRFERRGIEVPDRYRPSL